MLLFSEGMGSLKRVVVFSSQGNCSSHCGLGGDNREERLPAVVVVVAAAAAAAAAVAAAATAVAIIAAAELLRNQ